VFVEFSHCKLLRERGSVDLFFFNQTTMEDVSDIIRDLASTKADCLTGRMRHDLMTVAIESLQLSTQERKLLANRKGRSYHPLEVVHVDTFFGGWTIK